MEGGVNVGGFDWNLQFNWHAIPEREKKRRTVRSFKNFPLTYKLRFVQKVVHSDVSITFPGLLLVLKKSRTRIFYANFK